MPSPTTRSSTNRVRATMAARNELVPIGCMSGRLAPVALGRGERETDLVVEQVRRGVELHVQGAPEGGAHGAAVGFVAHRAATGAGLLRRRTAGYHFFVRERADAPRLPG